MTEAETKSLSLNEDSGRGFSRASRVVLLLIVGLYAATRLWHLTTSCLWFDEIFGLHAARHSWGGMLRFVAADIIHPPLFYVLLKVWTAVGGESLLWVRMLPALISIACVVPFLLLCRELRLRVFETNLALLLLAVNGYLIKYAQEVRMYSLLMLLTLFSLWLFARFAGDARETKTRGIPIALTVVNLLLVYTHYYGWLVVVTEIIFLALRRRARLPQFALSCALVAVCFAPWVYTVVRSAEPGRGVEQNLGWVKKPGSRDVAQFMALLHEPFYFRQSSQEPAYTRWTSPLGFLLFGLPLAALLWRRGRRDSEDARADATGTETTDTSAAQTIEEGTTTGETKGERATTAEALPEGLQWLLVFSFLPILLALALSWLLPQSVWGTRHLIIVAGPYIILAAFALWRLRPFWLKALLLVVLLGWLSLGASSVITRREGRYIWCAWEHHAASVVLAEDADAQDVQIYAFEDLVAYHLWFALDTARERRFRVMVVRKVPGLKDDPAYFLPRAFDGVTTGDISSIGGEHFWLAFRAATWDETRPPLRNLKEQGYTFDERREFEAQGEKAFLVSVRRR